MNRDSMLKILRNNPAVSVQFMKKDGTKRVMKCTLQESAVPKKVVKETLERIEDQRKPKPENLDIVKVWDLEAKGWRSFIVKNVSALSIAE